MGLAVMNADGKAELAGEIELVNKALPLRVASVVVLFPVVIKADLADGDDLRFFRPAGEPLIVFRRQGNGVFRVNADAAEYGALAFCQGDAAGGRVHGVAEGDDLTDACR